MAPLPSVEICRGPSTVGPARERRKAGIKEGGLMDVVSRGVGVIVVRRVPALEEI